MAEASNNRVVGPLETLRQLSKQSSEGEETSVSQEIELLQCVYLEELQLTYCESGAVDLQFHITPSTGDNKEKQYISLDLHLLLSQSYPEQPAEISVSASRGLSDGRIEEILTGLRDKALTLTGYPMVYELVEQAKDLLTDNNLPCGHCAVCLHPFHDGDAVTRTDCYHCLHIPCLARYLRFYQQQREQEVSSAGPTHFTPPPTPQQHNQPKSLECPVCREPIAADSACLKAVSTAPPTPALGEEQTEIFISQEMRCWQRDMARLLQQQREKGGLIDVTAKDQVIDETWVRPSAAVSAPAQSPGNPSRQHPSQHSVEPAAADLDKTQQPVNRRGRGRGRGRGPRGRGRGYSQSRTSNQ